MIGAGHNGLVAAAYLARAGLSVEVLERRDVVGGACVTEELWPGVRASPGAYTLSLLRRRIIDELDLAAHGLSVAVHEPYLFAPFPDGRKVVTWSDRERTHAQLATDWSPADADAYRDWSERWETAAARARPLMLEPPDRERWLAAIGPEILEGSIAEDLAGIPSEPVRVPFAIQGLIGTLAAPSDPGTAFVAFYHDLGEAAGPPGAWGYARGGMGAVTGALRAAAEAAGARVRRGAGGPGAHRRRAARAGVVLEGGEEVRRAWSSPTRTRCAPPRSPACPPPTAGARTAPRSRSWLLLDGLPDFPAWPGPEPWAGTIDIGFTLDDLAAAAGRRPGRPARRAALDRGRLPDRGRPDARAGGPPRRVAVLPVLPARRRRRAPRPTPPSRASPRSAPQLPDRILDRLALGPRELEARFGLTGGHIFHGEMLGGQLFESRFDAAALRRDREPLPRRLGRPSRRRRDRRSGLPRGAAVLEDLETL